MEVMSVLYAALIVEIPQPPYPKYLTGKEYAQWQDNLSEASRNNIWCHCRKCEREWVASTTEETCTCGSRNIQYVHCWMFPDD